MRLPAVLMLGGRCSGSARPSAPQPRAVGCGCWMWPTGTGRTPFGQLDAGHLPWCSAGSGLNCPVFFITDPRPTEPSVTCAIIVIRKRTAACPSCPMNCPNWCRQCRDRSDTTLHAVTYSALRRHRQHVSRRVELAFSCCTSCTRASPRQNVIDVMSSRVPRPGGTWLLARYHSSGADAADSLLTCMPACENFRRYVPRALLRDTSVIRIEGRLEIGPGFRGHSPPKPTS